MSHTIEDLSFHQDSRSIVAAVNGELSDDAVTNKICEALNSEQVKRIVKRRLEGGSLDCEFGINAGQEAYDAYANHTGYKSLATEQDLPKWDALPEAIRTAWHVAAMWIAGRVLRQHGLM